MSAYTRLRGCLRKDVYTCKADAKRMARWTAEELARFGDTRPMRAYLCPDCRLWHVGHARAEFDRPTWRQAEL